MIVGFRFLRIKALIAFWFFCGVHPVLFGQPKNNLWDCWSGIEPINSLSQIRDYHLMINKIEESYDLYLNTCAKKNYKLLTRELGEHFLEEGDFKKAKYYYLKLNAYAEEDYQDIINQCEEALSQIPRRLLDLEQNIYHLWPIEKKFLSEFPSLKRHRYKQYSTSHKKLKRMLLNFGPSFDAKAFSKEWSMLKNHIHIEPKTVIKMDEFTNQLLNYVDVDKERFTASQEPEYHFLKYNILIRLIKFSPTESQFGDFKRRLKIMHEIHFDLYQKGQANSKAKRLLLLAEANILDLNELYKISSNLKALSSNDKIRDPVIMKKIEFFIRTPKPNLKSVTRYLQLRKYEDHPLLVISVKNWYAKKITSIIQQKMRLDINESGLDEIEELERKHQLHIGEPTEHYECIKLFQLYLQDRTAKNYISQINSVTSINACLKKYNQKTINKKNIESLIVLRWETALSGYFNPLKGKSQHQYPKYTISRDWPSVKAQLEKNKKTGVEMREFSFWPDYKLLKGFIQELDPLKKNQILENIWRSRPGLAKNWSLPSYKVRSTYHFLKYFKKPNTGGEASPQKQKHE